MRDFKYYIMLLAGVLFMQSCLHEEEDIFGKSAAERLNEAQKLYENILTKPSNGWVLEYIAGDTDATRRGAFNFLLKFEDGSVTAAVDQNALDDIDPSMDPHKKITSLYKLEQDMSITLSFDTYNMFLHYYHEQHGSYTTYKGDFEFTIMEAYDDLIILRGKKYGNIMEMHRLPDNITWNDYLDQINNIYNQASEYPEFSIYSGANKLTSGSVLATRQLSYSYDGSSYLKNIVYTPTGMKFMQPLTINGKEAKNFVWDATKTSFICTDNGITDIVIKMNMPKGYIYYNEFLGTYILSYNNTTKTVTIEEKVKETTYTLKGLSDFDLELGYNKMTGGISLLPQDVGKSGGYTVSLNPWDTDKGYLSYSLSIGMVSSVNKDKLEKEGIIEFKLIDNGVWNTYIVNGFLLRLYDSVLGSHSSATYKGNYTPGYQFYNFVFTKQ